MGAFLYTYMCFPFHTILISWRTTTYDVVSPLWTGANIIYSTDISFGYIILYVKHGFSSAQRVNNNICINIRKACISDIIVLNNILNKLYWLLYWLSSWLMCWLPDWLPYWLIYWLSYWLLYWLGPNVLTSNVCWLPDWPPYWLMYWLTYWLPYWPITSIMFWLLHWLLYGNCVTTV